jgi:hypothetical protein
MLLQNDNRRVQFPDRQHKGKLFRFEDLAAVNLN